MTITFVYTQGDTFLIVLGHYDIPCTSLWP
jgi:hypothetical protein